MFVNSFYLRINEYLHLRYNKILLNIKLKLITKYMKFVTFLKINVKHSYITAPKCFYLLSPGADLGFFKGGYCIKKITRIGLKRGLHLGFQEVLRGFSWLLVTG